MDCDGFDQGRGGVRRAVSVLCLVSKKVDTVGSP